METIVLCFPVSPEQVAAIQRAAGDARIVVADQENIADRILEATIFCGHAKVPVNWPEVVQQGRLKWIQSTAAGLDHCLVPEVVASPITVSGASGLFSRQVAEQTLALLLALVRNLPEFFSAQRQHQYERLPTGEVRGKRVGILGFGGNGQRIAEYLRPLVRSLTATDVFPQSCQASGVHVVGPERMPEVLASSDIVICTLPLLDSTRLIIGAPEFAAMPRASYFINVGRGQVVDERALAQALENGHLAGAGIDVAFVEPLPPDSPLWQTRHLLITPHVGAQSQYRVPDTVRLFCDNLARWQKKMSLLNLVDKALGFPLPEHRIPLNWAEAE